jgi:SprT protein
MPKKEVPLNTLQQFLPEGTLQAVMSYLEKFRVHLTVTQERKSILGDYRHRTGFKNHRISVNGNLNKWAFLVTLVHELAHLLCFEQYGNRVSPHGTEWKKIYGSLLQSFLQEHVFPADIESELRQMLKNPSASSCAEDGLVRVLHRYDEKKSGRVLVEQLPENSLFRTTDGRVFNRGEKLRKRYKCRELKTGRWYLFSPVFEVERVVNSE